LLGLTVNLILTQANLPSGSSVLIVISKSPEAKKVAIEVEASGNSNKVSRISIRPDLILNGQVQSIPKSATAGGQLLGLKLSGSN